MSLLRRKEYYRENNPRVKGPANFFATFSTSKNNHIYSISFRKNPKKIEYDAFLDRT